eukprot:Lithocolla_globosa_v1_NODE_9505_length_699_cov_9.869565.p1 type:complete len:138 gc:universal NODE_9505_length_699_cov_9.869565:70-483(+)
MTHTDRSGDQSSSYWKITDRPIDKARDRQMMGTPLFEMFVQQKTTQFSTYKWLLFLLFFSLSTSHTSRTTLFSVENISTMDLITGHEPATPSANDLESLPRSDSDMSLSDGNRLKKEGSKSSNPLLSQSYAPLILPS